jgi:hypothetical protein
MRDAITFTPVGTAGMAFEVRSPHGRQLHLSGPLETIEPHATSDNTIIANSALINNAGAYAKHEKQYRRLKDPEKRKSHGKQADERAKTAVTKRLIGVAQKLASLEFVSNACNVLGNLDSGMCSQWFSTTLD